MAEFQICAIGLAFWAWTAGGLRAAETATLREAPRVGDTTRVLVALKADGFFRPSPPPGAPADAKPSKPLALKVETRFDFVDRVVKLDPSGQARRSVRRASQASAAINGEVRPTASALRPEVAVLVAERREGKIVVFSPGGPLTRPELELVQDVGDPLAFHDLLPARAVAVGDHWRAGSEAARALSGYDVLAANALVATLEALDDASARIGLKGEIRGALYGSGEGTIECSGTADFDRKEGRVAKLALQRTESRKPGEVEDGLDVKSTLTVERAAAANPAALSDPALADVPENPDPTRELLLFVAPDGKYTMLHDRDWHIWQDSIETTVLKWLDRGEVVAYCQLRNGPSAGKGRHQDPKQFRDDVRRALGARFGAFVGQGEVEGDPAGGYRYKVGVQGKQGTLGVVWDYYLVASPEGEQLLATFTLAAHHNQRFGDLDLKMIGSLRWKGEAKK